MNIAQGNRIDIRKAVPGDIAGIAALVASCSPYLTKHGPYLYLIYTRFFGDTCTVAVQDGSIVGWCSVFPVSPRRYFLHQLGVVPEARGQGIAFSIFSYLLEKLRKDNPDGFRLEFTTDRKNTATQKLNRKIASSAGMRLRKLTETIPALGDGGDEELYAMTPITSTFETHIPFAGMEKLCSH